MGSADHNIHYYDLRNISQPLHVFNGHKKAVSYVKFLSNNELASASTDSTLRLWDVKENLPVSYRLDMLSIDIQDEVNLMKLCSLFPSFSSLVNLSCQILKLFRKGHGVVIVLAGTRDLVIVMTQTPLLLCLLSDSIQFRIVLSLLSKFRRLWRRRTNIFYISCLGVIMNS